MNIILPAISVQQPWAYAILYLGKNIENRSWRLPPAYLNVPILLHASKTLNTEAFELFELLGLKIDKSKLFTGGIIGAIKFTDIPVTPNSFWAMENLNHWPIANAKKLPFLPYRGNVGFFKVPYPSDVMGEFLI